MYTVIILLVNKALMSTDSFMVSTAQRMSTVMVCWLAELRYQLSNLAVGHSSEKHHQTLLMDAAQRCCQTLLMGTAHTYTVKFCRCTHVRCVLSDFCW